MSSRSQRRRNAVIAWSAGARLGVALALSAAVWLAVLWVV